MMLILCGASGVALSGTTSAAGAPMAQAPPRFVCGKGQNQFTIENDSGSPLWLGETVTGAGNVDVPVGGPSGDPWRIDHGKSVSVCTTPPWSSGRFWARTDCNFTGLFASGDSNSETTGFTTCKVESDCTSLNNADLTYHCIAGACMVDCTGQTNAWCQTRIGPSGNTAATCNPFNSKVSYCSYPVGVVCATGDCNAQYQCEGPWTVGSDTVTLNKSGQAPATLFEPTSNKATSVNYDVSNVSGYNLPIVVSIWPSQKVTGADNCFEPKCASDLNLTCPNSLRVTEAPGAQGTIPCGSGSYCTSGICEACQSGDPNCDSTTLKTCVLGCNDPGDQCLALQNAGVNNYWVNSCSSPVATPTSTPEWTPDGSTYFDMYQASNQSKNVDPDHYETAMASPNQANATCWSDPNSPNPHIDCPPGLICDVKDFAGLGFPANVGVCLYPKGKAPAGFIGGLTTISTCTASTPAGTACGNYSGYSNSLGYTCNHVNITVGGWFHKKTKKGTPASACVPPVGDYQTTPCPGIDGEGANAQEGVGLGCHDAPHSLTALYSGSGGPSNPEWNAAAWWASGDGTAAGTKPFYQYFSEACPYAYGWTYDDIAGGFSCNTSAQGGNKKTVNFTIAFGKVSSPTPGGKVHCSPDGYLNVTYPTGPVTFPALAYPHGATAHVQFHNTAGAPLKLSYQFKTGPAADFKVAGGNCTTEKKLPDNQYCQYWVAFKPGKNLPAGDVKSEFNLTGTFPAGVCPAGSKQTVSVPLMGIVK
jgi:hypothetical protein